MTMASIDLVCVRCREKKIRCGREKGQCANCRRDGVECNYSTPGKRVNHLKLLCTNFSSLQERLTTIEGGLASLISSVQSNNSSFVSSEARPGIKAMPDIHDHALQEDEQMTNKEETVRVQDGRIIRDRHAQTDRYHGPGTLLTLCHQFRSIVTEHLSRLEDHSVRDAIEQHMSRLCSEAGNEEPIFRETPESTSIRLPPKRLVRVVEMQFFQQSHYAADVFVPSHFRAKVKELYSRPFTADDEVWAICLHIMILLVLGPDDEGLGGQSHPHTSTMHMLHAALANPSILMVPKMINLQTLALISNFAQQYYPLSVAESTHAQACVLAKTMGLHQFPRQEEMGLSPQEMEERNKVSRCLYIQSMGFTFARGSICWFPTLENPSMRDWILLTNDRQSQARLQLAEIQESIYRLVYTGVSSAHKQRALAETVDCLDRWAVEHRLFTPAQLNDLSTMDLRHDFFSTRTVAWSRSADAVHCGRTAFDARITCAMLLIACSACDPATAERLAPTDSEQLSPSHPLSVSRLDSSTASLYPNLAVASSSDLPPLSSQSILERFPIAAVFLLATALATGEPHSTAADRELLHRVSSYYLDLGGKLAPGNHILKIGRVFQIMLDSAQLLSTPKLSTPAPNDEALDHANHANVQPPGDSISEPLMLDLSALSSPGSSNMHNISSYPSLVQPHSSKPSRSGTRSPSVGTISSITSAADKPPDGLWMMPPFMPIPDARRPSRKRRLLDEGDIYFDLGEDAPLPDLGMGVGGNAVWP